MSQTRKARFLFLMTVLVLTPALHAYEEQINELAAQMADDIHAAEKKTIAVVDFTDLQGNVTELGRFLAEEFSVALAESRKGFEVIDRVHLKVILAENKLTTTGLIEPATAQELGRIAGAEALITGTITPAGDSVRVAIKILDTESARLVGAQRGNIPKTQFISELAHAEIASSKPSSGLSQENETASEEYVVNGLAVAPGDCAINSGKMTCHLFVTNTSSDREVRLYGARQLNNETFAVDSAGNKYPTVGIADSSGNYFTYFSILLPTNVRIRLNVRFEGVDSQPSHVDLLLVAMSDTQSNEDFNVQVRNLSVR